MLGARPAIIPLYAADSEQDEEGQLRVRCQGSDEEMMRAARSDIYGSECTTLDTWS